MKSGRDIYQALLETDAGRVAGKVAKLKGDSLADLLFYADGREASEAGDEILAAALIEAAQRYQARALKKRKRRVRRIL